MSNRFRGRIERVVDGDTFQVRDMVGNRAKIRLWGIDAPETAQPYGPAATKGARDLAEGEPCAVEVVDTDQYGRIIGIVEADSYNVNASLVKSGLAWHDQKYAAGADALREMEQEARSAGRGLWDQESPIPPWQYRNGGGAARQKATDGSAAVGFIVLALLILTIIVQIAAG